MDTVNEILDAIEILSDKKISENITKVLTGICKSVNINNNTCVMDSNGVSSTVQFYGSPPEVNGLYRIFVPSNDMSRAFVIVPPQFTVNPNLLDNWYFGNPVNQRGKTSYTAQPNGGYTIDRWMSTEAVSIDTVFQFRNLFQRVEGSDRLSGKLLTFSILMDSGAMLSGSKIFDASADCVFADQGILMLYNSFWKAFQIYSRDNSEVHILAAKLELGPTQTLAHREGDKWVLNEIPDYGEQLRRCQRYCRVYKAGEYLPCIAFSMEDGWYCSAMLPYEMRAVPVNNIGSNISVTLEPILGGTGIDTILENYGTFNGVQILKFSKAGQVFKSSNYFRVKLNADFILTADL